MNGYLHTEQAFQKKKHYKNLYQKKITCKKCRSPKFGFCYLNFLLYALFTFYLCLQVSEAAEKSLNKNDYTSENKDYNQTNFLDLPRSEDTAQNRNSIGSLSLILI